MEKTITKNFEDKEFEKARKKEDEEYDIDDIKEGISNRKGFIYG